MAKGARKLTPSVAPSTGAAKQWRATASKLSGVAGVCLLVMLVLGGAVELALYERSQSTKRVIVNGELSFLPKSQVEQVIAQQLNSSYYELDLNALYDAIVAQSWVKDAQVFRRWPYELVVNVVEETPVAFWGDAQLVNEQGELFLHQGFYSGAPLTRLDADANRASEVLQQYRLLSSQLSRRDIKVNRVSLNTAGSYMAVINDDVTLMIGHGEVAKRVKNLERVLDTGLDLQISQINRIDLRHKDSVAVQWKVQLEQKVATH